MPSAWPALVRYLLERLWHDKVLLITSAVLLAVAAMSMFLAGTVVTEARETATVMLGALGRLALVTSLSLALAIHIARAFEQNEVAFLLARPVGRTGLILGYAFVWLLVAVICVLELGLLLWLITPDPSLLPRWLFGLWLEILLAVLAGLFVAMSGSGALITSLTVLGWYTIARLQDVFIGLTSVSTGEWTNKVLGIVLAAIGWLTPRLDLYAPSSNLIYQPSGPSALLLTGQAAAYAALLLTATVFDFRRRSL